MLNSKQIKYLKSLANTIEAKYQIGKNNISDNTIELLDNALKKNELIKVSVNAAVKEEKEEIFIILFLASITLFRKNLKDGKIHLPK